MAEPIRCDYLEADPHLADVILSRIANGPAETTAWCNDHFLVVCRAVVDAAAAAEAEATDDAAVAALEGSIPPTTSESSSDAGGAAPGEPGRPADGRSGDDWTQTPPTTEAGPDGQPGVVGEAEADPATA